MTTGCFFLTLERVGNLTTKSGGPWAAGDYNWNLIFKADEDFHPTGNKKSIYIHIYIYICSCIF